MLIALATGTGCSRSSDAPPPDPLAGYRDDAEYTGLTIDYPRDETLFPPELPPPTFRWTDGHPQADRWVVTLRFADDEGRATFTTTSPNWTPEPAQWESIKRRTREAPAQVAILGRCDATPQTILSGARLTFRTSADEVGAPLFYREVNLPFNEAVKDPSTIRWRFGPISSLRPPPIVLEHLVVCGNCHSFSADGALLGLDVDYANDKGSYAIVPVREQIPLATSNIITWADFRRDDGRATFGLLSQVSPDGRFVVSTVKDRSVFVATPDLAFSQLFFPVQGILASFERATGTFRALGGADDPEYVQSNPAWSPDGQTIVFARSPAYRLRRDTGQVLLTREECTEFLDEGKTFLFDLYRVPFNNGAGGVAEPLPGASNNGQSNFFAKYSPDGRWIVFCKARSFMLLQPDSELYIMPAEGGEPRRLRCNTPRMNSWHSWSPNGKWLVFSSKANSAYTQLFLTHIDEAGESSPPVVLARMTAPDRAANIPEFVNAAPTAIARIAPQFVDDVSYVRAGDAFLRAGHDVLGAIQQYRKALELNPQNAVAHSNLGGLLVTQGALDEGVTHLKESIRLDPANGSPQYNLGMLRARQGQADEAVDLLTQALRAKPELADAHRVLGALLCSRNAVPAGLEHLQTAVRLDPKDAVAQYLLGKTLAGQNRPAEAVPLLTRAVELDPQYTSALVLLSQLLFAQGKSTAAIRYLTQAVQIKPDDAAMLSDLAWMLAMTPDPAVRDPERAIELALQACDLTKQGSFTALDMLGVSYAAAGRFPDAVAAAQRALDLARAAGQDQAAASIEQRIKLYQQNQPYRLHAP